MRGLFASLVLLSPLVASCDRLQPAGEGTLDQPIQFANPGKAIQWQDAPPSMPSGSLIAILEGDPQSKGLFTLRIKVPAGARMAPHWHPRNERVTVLYGRVGVGFGEQFDESRLSDIIGGGYYVNPARQKHYLSFPVESLVQITGMGPWETHFAAQAGQH